ncbi:DHA2 family efflux MFS transporter permease subunit [Nocardia higoensis]|uniref:DHA2 family efflux MFS transporter permease subunit n=1 Tax=Nocardia higoensis TaxID=228599 RepID=UPI001E3F1C1E|nr:DHA2 family efflux MFS transporter permease subunit [Nocardia higoensis]
MATAGAETGPQRSPGAIWTLVVVALATFMLMLDLTVVNVALPDIRAAFDSSFSALQWILDAYALGLAAVLLAAGSLADRLGRKRVFDVGLVVFVLSSLACGLAPSDEVLIVARFVQGLGGAILFAVGPALLGHEFRGKDRGMAFGVFGAVTGLAIAFGPLIGGGLAESAGWRWIFLINVPVTVAAIVIGYLKMRESRSETPPPVDWPGMVAFSAGLFFLVLGFMRGEADGWTSWIVLGCFALAVALLAGFTWLQITKPEQAMFDLSLFGNRTFNGLSVVTALCALTVMPALFLLIAYVQNMLGHSAFASGLRFLPLTLLLFVAAAGAGTLVTKVHPGVLVGISQLLIAAGLAAVVLVDTESAWTALIPAMILIGLGMGVFNPPRAAFSIAVTTPDKSGMASGINETFQQAGVAVGIAAVGAFFHNQVSGAFAETDTAREVFDDQAATAGDAVAAGGPAAVLENLPAAATDVVRSAAEAAFVDGLHTTMLLVAALAAVSGVIALFTMRPGDLDEAALDSPGVPADGASGSTTDRPTDRPSELAAQRAAQIIAQAKADAQDAGGAGRTVSATLTEAPAAPVDTARRSKSTPRSAQARGGAATGQRHAATPDSDEATIRTAPVGRPRDAAPRRNSSTARRTTAVDRPVTPSTSAGDPGSRTTGSTSASAPGSRTARSARGDAATASAVEGEAVENHTVEPASAELAPVKGVASTGDSVPRSPISGRFTEATARRAARTSDIGATNDLPATERPGVATRTAALSDAEKRAAAGKHRLTDPEAIASAARAARSASATPTAPTADIPAPGEEATATAAASPASEFDSTASAAATGARPAEAATAGAPAAGSAAEAPSSAGRRATARSRTNGETGGKHRASGADTTAATPRHASGRRATTTPPATTPAAATSPVANASTATASDVGASGSTTSGSLSSAATADAEAESAATEQTAAKRSTARKRTRGAAKAPAAQTTPPGRATEQPAKADGQPAKAAKQPAKRTANATARSTAAKKAAAGEKGTTSGARGTTSGTRSTAAGTRSTAGTKSTASRARTTATGAENTAKTTAAGARRTAADSKSTASSHTEATADATGTANRGSSSAAATGGTGATTAD